MKHLRVFVLSMVAVFGLVGEARSQEPVAFESLMVSKEANGQLNRESRVAIRELNRLARQNGQTAVWVTLASTYVPPYAGQLSQTELEEQDRRATEELMEILDPLVQSGSARHAKDGPLIQGPGCLIMVDQKGLGALVRDRRVAQIVGHIDRSGA